LHENWANLNGLKIRYLESGKGNDRHILFIHGLGSSADRWLGIPSALSANFHTVSLDLPGFGESDKPATMDYTIENFRKTVVDFINELAINDAKTSIVGHSLGGVHCSRSSYRKQKHGRKVGVNRLFRDAKKTNTLARRIPQSGN